MTSIKCPVYSACGGCQSQHIPYEEQVLIKENLLSELFNRKVSVVRNPVVWNYRNRMDFVFNNGFLGLKNGFSKFIKVPFCSIADSRINDLLKKITPLLKDVNDKWLRYVTIRAGIDTQIILTTKSTDNSALVKKIAFATNTNLVWSVADHSMPRTIGRIHKVYGDLTIRFKVLNKEYYSHPAAFFQSSISCFNEALTTINSFVDINSVVVDAYCGAGVIGLSITNAKRVIGIEQDEEAVAAARKNNYDNRCEFIIGNAQKIISDIKADIIIVDPPRSGLMSGALKIINSGAKKIIYLSCNPKTLRKDIIQLRQKYDVIHIQGFDFFPHTKHLEVLAVLKVRK